MTCPRPRLPVPHTASDFVPVDLAHADTWPAPPDGEPSARALLAATDIHQGDEGEG